MLVDKSEIVSGQPDRDSLCLSRFQRYLFECSQPAYIGSDGCHLVAAEKQHRLFTLHAAAIGNIDRQRDGIAGSELRSIYLQVGIIKRRVAQTITKRILHRGL